MGGDMFRVEQGELEVVDTRTRPEVILDRVGAGEILGELSFVDGTPRSADVVAGTGCLVLRWPRDVLERLIVSNPDFAARFWRALAEAVTERLRGMSAHAASGALGGPSMTDVGGGSAATSARTLARTIRDELAALDLELRLDPSDPDASTRACSAMQRLSDGMVSLATECGGREELVQVARGISREIRPFLLQARTANLAISRHGGRVGNTNLVRHLLHGEPTGDSPLGRIVDGWLLASPQAVGQRSRTDAALQAARQVLQGTDGLRILVVNGVASGLSTRLYRDVMERPGTMVVVESDRELLADMATVVVERSTGMRIQYAQDDLAELVHGRSLRNFRNQDLVVLDALLEYLPARVATRCLQHLGSLLGPSGRILATALVPAPDAGLWEHLLEWPTIRQTSGFTRAVAGAAGYRFVTFPATEAAGMVLLAGNSATRAPRSPSPSLPPGPT